ncbi:TetR/AcrR family transcriptional regulator [Microbispora hainanensis]|uniref:TetR/AcrR family transcriptional regulator n=1 Tax=Microbispora TaxID=2005 RepID=UPI00115A3F28|nr:MULTISPECIES: TetR/AcrR family transcriptional regulator [Microbispora]NJP28340.1 TetR/AcrR family transcriptional regulator [Microbispora sp. CL1-1]TQS09170.1 TetR/AcrR family transcriptional regulator [Microbispora sp. SCL1-1]
MGGRREEILEVALAIADERGLDGVSMRAVAERVGVTPMALYRHVGGKAELLDAMVGHLLAALLPPDRDRQETQRWDERLAALARAVRTMVRRHPWAAPLLFSRPAVTPDAVRTVDVIYDALIEAGVPDREVPRLERLLSTFVIGFAASEVSGRFTSGDPDPRGHRGSLPEGDFPAHARLKPWLRLPDDLATEFEADLDDVLRLIEAAAGRR